MGLAGLPKVGGVSMSEASDRSTCAPLDANYGRDGR